MGGADEGLLVAAGRGELEKERLRDTTPELIAARLAALSAWEDLLVSTVAITCDKASAFQPSKHIPVRKLPGVSLPEPLGSRERLVLQHVMVLVAERASSQATRRHVVAWQHVLGLAAPVHASGTVLSVPTIVGPSVVADPDQAASSAKARGRCCTRSALPGDHTHSRFLS